MKLRIASGTLVAGITFVAGSAPVPARAQVELTPFLTENVDLGEFLGTHTSIALDRHGEPHISYKDEITIRLKYAHREGEVWTVEVVDDPAEDVGTSSSIALDSNDIPYVAYYDDTLDRVKLASRVGGSWTTEIVDDPAQDVGRYLSLAIDSQDHPAVAYYDDTLNRLKYAIKIGGSWFRQVVHDPAQDVGLHPALAFDNSDQPHIAYVDSTLQDIRYAALLGSSWSLVPVATDTTQGPVDLGLDATGRAHVIYRKGNVAKYAQNYDYPLWIQESIEPCHGGLSIAVDPAGTPRVAIYAQVGGGGQVLRFGERVAVDTWEMSTVDRAGTVGQYPSLALDRQGSPRISYYDQGTGHLRYADASLYVRDPAGGAAWPVGAERTIRWDGIGPVDVSLSVNGGRTFELIQSAILDREITIPVPHAPSRFARVRITRTDPFATAESDSFFTISSSVSLLAFDSRPAEDPASGMHVSWTTDPGPEDLAGYRLERTDAAGAWATELALTRDTSYRDIEGNALTRYRLFAVNGFGSEFELGETIGALSRVLSASPLPYREGTLSIAFATASAPGGGPGEARVGLFDVTGRLVRSIAEGRYAPGLQSAQWDGRDEAGRTVPPGTYFLRLTTGGQSETAKITVMR